MGRLFGGEKTGRKAGTARGAAGDQCAPASSPHAITSRGHSLSRRYARVGPARSPHWVPVSVRTHMLRVSASRRSDGYLMKSPAEEGSKEGLKHIKDKGSRKEGLKRMQ